MSYDSDEYEFQNDDCKEYKKHHKKHKKHHNDCDEEKKHKKHKKCEESEDECADKKHKCPKCDDCKFEQPFYKDNSDCLKPKHCGKEKDKKNKHGHDFNVMVSFVGGESGFKPLVGSTIPTNVEPFVALYSGCISGFTFSKGTTTVPIGTNFYIVKNAVTGDNPVTGTYFGGGSLLGLITITSIISNPAGSEQSPWGITIESKDKISTTITTVLANPLTRVSVSASWQVNSLKVTKGDRISLYSNNTLFDSLATIYIS